MGYRIQIRSEKITERHAGGYMKRYLWIKLLICYIFSAVLMFVLLNTYGADRYEKKLIEEKKSLLYNEAASISSGYMTGFYNEELSLPYLTTQIKTIGSILDARIWIVNTGGLVISDTKPDAENEEPIKIFDIDSDFLDETFHNYTIMKDVLSEPMISVVYRVFYKYQVRGYIVMHSALS